MHRSRLTGFRPGGYKPDTVWSYEIGEKAKQFDGRLTLNTGWYFEKWANVQQYVTLNCGYVYSDNTGLVHVYGTEIEINALVIPDVTVALNGGYTHARVVQGSLETGVAIGAHVQDVPDLTGSAAIIYRHTISDDLAFTGRIENNFVGSRTDATYFINHLPSYDLTNLRAGLVKNQWSAMLFAKNLTNERALLSDTLQIGINVPTFNRISVGQPLTVGVDFSYHFKQ